MPKLGSLLDSASSYFITGIWAECSTRAGAPICALSADVGPWILLNDLDYALSRSSINFRHALDQTLRQLIKRLCCGRTLFAGERQRTSGITGLADFGVELHRAEQRNVKLAGGALASAFGEDIHFVSAMRAHEVAHVLD